MIENPPPWPNGARCAVAFSFDVDADSVVHASHGANAVRMPHALAHMRYDPFVATPRLAKMFSEHGVPMTCFVPGWVAETYPAAVEAIVAHGNELGHHGHFHEWPSRQSPAQERESLERGSEALFRLSGKRPRGYRAPYYGLSDSTYDLLVELGLTYDSSLFADDVPILLETARGRLVELPVPASIDERTLSRSSNSPSISDVVIASEVSASAASSGLSNSSARSASCSSSKASIAARELRSSPFA